MYKCKRLFSAMAVATGGTIVGVLLYQHTANELGVGHMGSEMAIRDSSNSLFWNYKAVLEL